MKKHYLSYLIAICVFITLPAGAVDEAQWSAHAGAVQFIGDDNMQSETGVFLEARRTSASGSVYVGPSFMGTGSYKERISVVRPADNGHHYDCIKERCIPRETVVTTVESDRDLWIAGPWVGLNYPVHPQAILSFGIGWQHTHINAVGSDWGAGARLNLDVPIDDTWSIGAGYFKIFNDIEDSEGSNVGDIDAAVVSATMRF